jgi:hypothetical protein
MQAGLALLTDHVARFNAGVRSGDFGPMVDGFTEAGGAAGLPRMPRRSAHDDDHNDPGEAEQDRKDDESDAEPEVLSGHDEGSPSVDEQGRGEHHHAYPEATRRESGDAHGVEAALFVRAPRRPVGGMSAAAART